jgi:phosphoglycolate phosphatase
VSARATPGAPILPRGRPLRLAVFDCDGTLVDSQHGIFAAMSAAFESFSLAPPSQALARRVIGLPLVDALAALAPVEAGLDPERLAERYRDAFHAGRHAPDIDEPLFAGAVAALDALEAEGFLLGIATGKGRRGLEATLGRHDILSRFVTLQTSDSGPGKPHPAMLLRAMAETGAAPAETVMIGDTSFDMRMARAAEVLALGVGWGYHAAEELTAAGAHAVVPSFPALPPALFSLLP